VASDREPLTRILQNSAQQAGQAITQTMGVVKAAARAEAGRIGGALGLGVLGLGFLFLLPVPLMFALAWGLAEAGLPLWASFLIVAGVIVLIAAGLALGAWVLLRRMAEGPKAAARAIKGTLAALKGQAPGTADATTPTQPAPPPPSETDG
jgi:hypothetical protein